MIIDSTRQLPTVIDFDSKEEGSHIGDTTVTTCELLVTGTITGNMTIKFGGVVKLTGVLIGNCTINAGGTLIIQKSGILIGEVKSQGILDVQGTHKGIITLLTASETTITGFCEVDGVIHKDAVVYVYKPGRIKGNVLNYGRMIMDSSLQGATFSGHGESVFMGEGSFK